MLSVRPTASRLMALFAGSNLRARSMRASALTLSSFGFQKIIQLGSNLILTRILFPEAFGLMALVSVFLTGLTLLSDVGIGPSLIRSQRADEPVFQSTAWTLQIVRNFVIFAFALILAWPYSQIYDEPLLFPLICVAALSVPIRGFRSIEMGMRQRQLALGRIVVLQLVNATITTALTVLLAWTTQSVWGLAVGTVLGVASQVTLSHLLMPSRNHRFTWNRAVIDEILVFGRWILVATAFHFFADKGIQALRGVFVELETLAFLHIAAMFAWMISDLSTRVIESVGYSALSEVARTRPQAIRRVTAKIRTVQTLVTTPGFIVMALIAQPMVDLLYDDRYAMAGPFLTVMALTNAVAALPKVYQRTLLALGDSRTHAVATGIGSALRIGGVVVGFQLGGVMGILIAEGVAVLLMFAISAAIAMRKGYATLGPDLVNLAVVGVAFALLVPPLL